jgi:cyclopropane-fatty-acyl-phospholipid synthase
MWYEALIERGVIPDGLLRRGIRHFLARELARQARGGEAAAAARGRALLAELRASPIAIATAEANRQHYALPPEFFVHILGPRLKYSCAYWPDPVRDLGAAEGSMLELYAERAALADGQEILELGCGWGSLCLWLAGRYPGARVLAVSNAGPQRDFILARAAERGLRNLQVVTGDMNDFDPGRRFDRVLSIEMLEHMRNYELLFARIARWLEPAGFFFAHVFAHDRYAYAFRSDDPADWIGRHFFAGGLMPAVDLFRHFQRDLELRTVWRVNGRHYARTAEAWLANLDRHRTALAPICARVYGPAQSRAWLENWRVFFLSCAELWGYRGGEEWLVAHYLFAPAAARAGGR